MIATDFSRARRFARCDTRISRPTVAKLSLPPGNDAAAGQTEQVWPARMTLGNRKGEWFKTGPKPRCGADFEPSKLRSRSAEGTCGVVTKAVGIGFRAGCPQTSTGNSRQSPCQVWATAAPGGSRPRPHLVNVACRPETLLVIPRRSPTLRVGRPATSGTHDSASGQQSAEVKCRASASNADS
jgi:hypothetical protein